MNPLARTGALIVVGALVCYTIAVVGEQRRRRLHPQLLAFLTTGVLLDVTATAFMILGSSSGAFTLHGLLGYSSLGAMTIDTALLWRLARATGATAEVPASLHRFTRLAYCWWVAAFVTGGLLVAMR